MVKPVSVDKEIVRRYRQVIENRLFPFPIGLEITLVPTGTGEGLIVLSIPSKAKR